MTDEQRSQGPEGSANYVLVLLPRCTRAPTGLLDRAKLPSCKQGKARASEGVWWSPLTEEQRSNAPQIGDLATEIKPVGALTRQGGGVRHFGLNTLEPRALLG